MSDQQKISTREIVTVAVCGAIVIDAIIYWIIQIDGVMEVLKLAAG